MAEKKIHFTSSPYFNGQLCRTLCGRMLTVGQLTHHFDFTDLRHIVTCKKCYYILT